MVQYDEFKSLFLSTYDNGCPTYIRLSRDVNKESRDVRFGEANVIRKGKAVTIIAVGPILEMVLEAAEGVDATILYYTTIHPFDANTLIEHSGSGKILVCEPYYEGAIDYDITSSLKLNVIIDHCGIPHELCKHYGTTKENYAAMGLTVENIKEKIEKLVKTPQLS